MLRLNRFIVSKQWRSASNSGIKSNLYYSSEPPDKVLSIRSDSPTNRKPIKIESSNSEPFFRLTTSELNIFGPHDRRAPLNGNIGLGFEERRRIEAKAVLNLIRNSTTIEKIKEINKTLPIGLNSVGFDIKTFISETQESHRNKVFQILRYQDLFNPQKSVTKMSESLDFSSHHLPERLIRKFDDLFPLEKRNEFKNGLTVVTLTKKTMNDMTSYSEDVEIERENFFQQFVSDANNICSELQKTGFWADFIDPYSGQPFLSEPTNQTLFETDDRFESLGFRIEDLGCCKAIYHKKWATHVIVGTLFTTAPANSQILSQLMENIVNK